MPTARAGWPGALIVLLAACLFGSLGVASRFAYDAGVEPFAFVAWRAGAGAVGLLLVILVIRSRQDAAAPSASIGRGARAPLILAALLGSGVNMSMFLAFDRTTVALALLVFYTYPAMIAGVSVLLGREPLDLARVAALVLALAGMIAVVLGGLGTGAAVQVDPLGILLSLSAAAFQTAFVLTAGRYASVRADVAIGAVLAGSAVIAGVATIATGGVPAMVQPLGSGPVVALLIGVGLFAAALPSVLLLTGIRWIGGVRTGILMLFEPVVGVALAAALLAEGLQPLQVAGGATILVAALLVQRGSRGSTEAAPLVAPVPGGP
jgi:drug/metabolite transporter (DMT)-like permease